MEKVPLLLMFLGHVWVDTSQGVLPVVAAKLATHKVQIHGWVYDIKSGTIRCCGHNDDHFSDFSEHYASVIAAL